MKKILLPSIFLAFAGTAMAQDVPENSFIEYFYGNKISPNGKYMGSGKGLASLYNTETGNISFFEDGILGLGNSVANNGVSVGMIVQAGGLFYPDGTAYVPQVLDRFILSSINGITPDATKVCGYIANPSNGPAEIPFYGELTEDGELLLTVLPYPGKDLMGEIPQFIVTNAISGDGNTIVGNVRSGTGYFNYPIVFQKDKNGDWNYTLPTDNDEFFNPDGIEMPENPMEAPGAPKFPEYKDYMDADLYEQYEQELGDFFMGYSDFMPDPLDFMNSKQTQDYLDALDVYTDYENDPDVKEQFNAWLKSLQEIVETSILFELNDITLSPDGKLFATTQVTNAETEELDKSYIWLFNIEDGSYKKIESKYTNIKAEQILSNGTIVAGMPYMLSPITTYVLLPDATEFISIKEYLQTSSPALYTWMEDNLYTGTGIVTMSDDMQVYGGGIVFGNLYPDSEQYELMDEGGIEYATYVFGATPNYSAVDKVKVENNAEGYEVYNLQGVKVMQTLQKEELGNLLPGLYIINGKKVAVK